MKPVYFKFEYKTSLLSVRFDNKKVQKFKIDKYSCGHFTETFYRDHKIFANLTFEDKSEYYMLYLRDAQGSLRKYDTDNLIISYDYIACSVLAEIVPDLELPF